MFHPFKGGCAFFWKIPIFIVVDFFWWVILGTLTSIQYPRIPVVRDPGALTLAAMLKN